MFDSDFIRAPVGYRSLAEGVNLALVPPIGRL